jgi:hypothetical protein
MTGGPFKLPSSRFASVIICISDHLSSRAKRGILGSADATTAPRRRSVSKENKDSKATQTATRVNQITHDAPAHAPGSKKGARRATRPPAKASARQAASTPGTAGTLSKRDRRDHSRDSKPGHNNPRPAKTPAKVNGRVMGRVAHSSRTLA